jgi:LuxR family quorum sensing-dependent transcriptional regulator
MTEFQEALEFIERVEETSSLDELRTLVVAVFERFGVPNFSIVAMLAETEGAARTPVVMMKHSDAGWAENYWRKGHFNLDPAIHGAITRVQPFSWSDIENGRLSKEARDLFSEIREAMPVDGGYVIPVHDEEGFAGFIALYHADPNLSQKARAALKLIGLYAMERAKELHSLRHINVAMTQVCPLTARQRQVLSFVADGKSDWDIGVILKIATATVNEHVEKAKELMGVKTRTQAVAIAVRRGWIRIQ